MADRPVPKGRGALLLQMLEKHKAETKAAPGIGLEEPKEPIRGKGRAALLAKLQQQKEKRAGGDGFEKHFQDVTAALPERGSLEEVTKATQKLRISESSSTSSEPSYYKGESGNPLPVSANYIKLEIEENRGVFEYEVKFRPEVDAKSNRHSLVNQVLGEIATTKVYDGDMCLYLPLQVFQDSKDLVGTIKHSNEKVTVRIIFKKKKRLSECLHLYNVLFKRIMHILLYSRIGRNYFSPEHKHIIPQHKLEVYPGFVVSCDEMEGGLMLCLDTQHRVVRTQTVYDLLQEYIAANPRGFRESAKNNIIGSCVMTKYNNKTYIVDDISWEMCPRDTFPTRDGTPCTFVDYYKQHYNIAINDVDQPLLLVTMKKENMPGTTPRCICLIPELTYLTGLTDAMRNDFKVMKDVAAFTRVTPNQRMLALRTYLNNVRKSEMAQNVLAGWGLKIASDALNIRSRVLPAEGIYFGGSGSHTGGADWNRAVTENRVTGPVDLYHWIVFYTPRDERYASNFAQTIVRLAKNMGCVIKDPKLIVCPDDRCESYVNLIERNYSDVVQVMVFICPNLRADRYCVIKKVCCSQHPIASQVILSKTLSNPSKVRTIIHKIALQINCKLGGTLWTVKMPIKGWMVCGIDVYHGAGQASVCGFVASTNDSLTNYYNDAIFQEREISDYFKVSFRKALQQYKLKSGSFPNKIILFRDGVSDGQLEQCRRYELPQFEDVLKEFKLEIPITFVVVQKRINTRIFEIKSNDFVNPPAGTVVDSDITRRNMYDFYLVPQTVRQGTVNPSHYIVVHDGANIKPDHLQRLAYKLCHLYYNWPGTIRVPGPCQYAHKLAQLVGQYIKRVPSNQLCDKLYYL